MPGRRKLTRGERHFGQITNKNIAAFRRDTAAGRLPIGRRLPAALAMLHKGPIMERRSLDESVIDVMRADPKPHVFIGQLDSQDAVFQRHPRRPDFLPVAVAEFFELQGRVPRIVFQQGELFISPRADVGGQGAIVIPEIRVRPVDHYGPLRGVVCFRLCGRPRRD
jgi:hypothetical protein